MRHCLSLQAKGLQSKQVSNFEIWKKNLDILGSRLIFLCKWLLSSLRIHYRCLFFQTLDYDIWQFGSPWNYKNAQQLL